MAQRQLLELTDWMEKEVTIEGVLRSRGFEDALATVHTDSVNVLVRCESITQQNTRSSVRSGACRNRSQRRKRQAHPNKLNRSIC